MLGFNSYIQVRQIALAIRESRIGDIHAIEHRKEQVGHGHILTTFSVGEVLIVLEAHIATTRQYKWIVVIIVGATIGSAKEYRRIVEQTTIPLWGVCHLLQKASQVFG